MGAGNPIDRLLTVWSNAMKIYTKIIIDISSGKTVYEESFEYEGPLVECKGGSSGGDQETTVRYAPYVEEHHESFLDATATYRKATTDDSPFDGYTDIEVENAFFGTGYTIASFPTLYDMFGKFIAGLDIDTLFSQIFEDTVNAPEVNDLVAAEGALIQDDVDEAVTAIEVGMRDINSVQASTFVIARAIPRDTKIKVLEKFRSELKYRLIPVATDRWKTHLEWNKSVIMAYAEVMKLYYSVKMDITDINYSMAAKDKLWPFTVLDYERANIGALQGATKTTTGVEDGGGGALAGALAGASAGSAFGGWGALAGGVLGLASSL